MNTVTHADWTATLASCPDESVDMVLCDLPYGTTQNAWDTVIDLAAWWPEIRRVTKPNAAVVLFAQCPFDKVLGASNLRELKYEWVWRKEAGTGHLNAKIAPMKNHEVALVFYRAQPTYVPQMRKAETRVKHPVGSAAGSANYGAQVRTFWKDEGHRYPLTVLDFPRDPDKAHPTQKPVDLCRYLIRTYTRPGEVVLDPTCGSGTTAVAAVMEQRRFIVGDSDEKWAAHAAARVRDAQAQGALFAAV